MDNFMYYVGYFLGGALIIVPIVVFLILLIFIPLFLYKKYKGKQPGAVEPEVQKYKTKKKLKILTGCLCVALAISIGFNIYQANSASKTSKELLALQTKYTNLEAKYNELNDTYTPLYAMADFYFQSTVIIPENTKTYHTYFCETNPTNGSWYIHNKEYAAWLGYKPCSKCNPPQ